MGGLSFQPAAIIIISSRMRGAFISTATGGSGQIYDALEHGVWPKDINRAGFGNCSISSAIDRWLITKPANDQEGPLPFSFHS